MKKFLRQQSIFYSFELSVVVSVGMLQQRPRCPGSCSGQAASFSPSEESSGWQVPGALLASWVANFINVVLNSSFLMKTRPSKHVRWDLLDPHHLLLGDVGGLGASQPAMEHGASATMYSLSYFVLKSKTLNIVSPLQKKKVKVRKSLSCAVFILYTV